MKRDAEVKEGIDLKTAKVCEKKKSGEEQTHNTAGCSGSLSPVCLTCVLEVQERSVKVVTQLKYHCRYSVLIKQLLKTSSSSPMNSIPHFNSLDRSKSISHGTPYLSHS